MIFSVANTALEHEVFSTNEIDLFCYFTVKNSIHLPISSLKMGILASLKQKKEVFLLLEPGLPEEISRNLQWDAGDHWLWLSPRSASLISAAWDNSLLESATLEELISRLKLLK